MIWLEHKKYTAEYVSGQFSAICERVRTETRRMIYVASAAVCLMIAVQMSWIAGM